MPLNYWHSGIIQKCMRLSRRPPGPPIAMMWAPFDLQQITLGQRVEQRQGCCRRLCQCLRQCQQRRALSEEEALGVRVKQRQANLNAQLEHTVVVVLEQLQLLPRVRLLSHLPLGIQRKRAFPWRVGRWGLCWSSRSFVSWKCWLSSWAMPNGPTNCSALFGLEASGALQFSSGGDCLGPQAYGSACGAAVGAGGRRCGQVWSCLGDRLGGRLASAWG